jgi:hypothetical protein
VALSLRVLEIEDESGNVETIRTTEEHPLWAVGQGWVNAGDLVEGQQVELLDGWGGTVKATRQELHGEGVKVYNFTVEDGHTYFVEDGQGAASAVWVHNAYASTSGNNLFASLGRRMHTMSTRLAKAQGYTVKRALGNGTIPDAFKLLWNRSGNRITGAIVRELKSSRPASVAKGLRQLRGYSTELVRMYKKKGLTLDKILQILETY